jgi:hypothetical protein
MPEAPTGSLAERVRDLMPALTEDLKALMAIPSVSAPPPGSRPASGRTRRRVDRDPTFPY